MKKSLKKIKPWLLPFVFLLASFFLLRLVNLTSFPLFADEAIYIRWSQVMRAEPTLRFLPLSDGKQPLFMWFLMGWQKLFSDPVLAGRTVSVLSGLGSLFGLGAIFWLLSGQIKVVFWGLLLYLLWPYFVFFDRLALVDSLLNMWGLWFFALTLALSRWPRLDLALLSGMALGVGLLTKSPAIFFAFALPFTLFYPLQKLNFRPLWRHFCRLFPLWLVTGFLAFMIYNLLRLGPGFDMIASRNRDYVFSFKEVFTHPLDPLRPHLNDLADWFPNLFTWPGMILIILGFWHLLKIKPLFLLFLLPASLGPLFAESFIAKVFTPRYLLFALWPFLVFAGFGLNSLVEWLAKKTLPIKIALLGFCFLPALFYDYRLLFQPQAAPLPRRMRSGYLEEWSSGYGLAEIKNFLLQRLTQTESHLLVGTEGYFGTLPDGLQIYFDHHPRVTILGVGQPVINVPDALLNARVNNEVYLVVNRSRFQTNDPRLELIAQYPKAVPPAGEADALLLLRLKDD